MIESTQDQQYKHDTEKKTLYVKKHFLKMLKIIVLKEEIIAIILENIEVQDIKYVICCIILQEKYQVYFIMVLVMITIS